HAIEDAGKPPPRTNVALRGEAVPLKEILTNFQSGLLIAVVVIFLLLTANFQSRRLSLVVISTVPGVLAGVALILWLAGTPLNIQSAMGAIMSVGVAVANAILLVTFAERARAGQISSPEATEPMDARQAAIDGGRSRLRPILMTSCAMIAGMTPMALGLGK